MKPDPTPSLRLVLLTVLATLMAGAVAVPAYGNTTTFNTNDPEFRSQQQAVVLTDRDSGELVLTTVGSDSALPVDIVSALSSSSDSVSVRPLYDADGDSLHFDDTGRINVVVDTGAIDINELVTVTDDGNFSIDSGTVDINEIVTVTDDGNFSIDTGTVDINEVLTITDNGNFNTDVDTAQVNLATEEVGLALDSSVNDTVPRLLVGQNNSGTEQIVETSNGQLVVQSLDLLVGAEQWPANGSATADTESWVDLASFTLPANTEMVVHKAQAEFENASDYGVLRGVAVVIAGDTIQTSFSNNNGPTPTVEGINYTNSTGSGETVELRGFNNNNGPATMNGHLWLETAN